jgi:flagellar protein FliL
MAKEQKLEETTETEETEVDAEGGEANENTEEPAKGLLSGKLKWPILVGGPLLLIGIVAGVLYFLGVFGGSKAEQAVEKKPEAVPIAEQLHDVFTYNLPSMLINLRTTGRRTSFLKVTMSLEVKGTEETKKEMDQVKPRIVDTFQTYLRELEVDDLQGSAGLQRLKEELLDRVNAVTAPIKVQNVLFGELLVQ